jgi:lysyl-tRNA synthetase class 2
MYANPETIATFKARSRIVSGIRRFMEARNFVEVETPMMQPLAGGAAARPFVTHHNTLDMSLYLRVAPELYLKRLLVGGLPRVFEINRNFRNEGIDRSHNPEFTMLEVYEAFGDCWTMLELTESLCNEMAHVALGFFTENIEALSKHSPKANQPIDLSVPVETEQRSDQNVLGAVEPLIQKFVWFEQQRLAVERYAQDPSRAEVQFGPLAISFQRPFARVAYGELFLQRFGFDMTDRDKTLAKAIESRIENASKLDHWLLVSALFDAQCEELIDPAKPTFVTDFPSAISPLTRPQPDKPHLSFRWELFTAGMELANSYTELNDPDVQLAKFTEQLKGADEEVSIFRSLDEDFIHALRVGMPPAGGLGVGVDRLVMLLTNRHSIRDVILFPLMRRETAKADHV